ncbi:general secretion pathway protein GspE [Anaeromyxobacter sp. Fw109-5]|uniref:GspE/PulE/PilB domain-containing protein n=1 Tax=Anaeromyxobacter sp. (strain Fw109-5) TaxID=404589 RepID=UPI000158A59A|nr:general secretion pathway protein GspE [Anaeromyxobacter sp. Fw109-5]ABS24488.1 General secretory system II protein E domain protein [Anaeromyxobacter sp. Fw109-5]
MPKDLAALLVEEGVVTADVMERALARRDEAGGALDTALLELGALPEDALAIALAGAADVPPAPPEAFAGGDARARRVFPARVADRHGLAPFALDGRELSVVSVFPVDAGLLDEIGFMLSLHLTAYVAPEWRVRLLVHQLYGTPIAPRFAAMAVAAGALAREDSPGEADAAPGTEEREEGEAAPVGFGGDDEGPLEPLAAALAQALEEVDPGLVREALAPAGGDAAAIRDAAPGAEEDVHAAPPDRSAPPGWTLEHARAALAAARTRDEVVLVALRYARDFFAFAAMFAVTRDAVAGHDALGVEPEARELARGVAIYADDPGTFRTVIETKSPYLGPVSREPAGNAAILAGLDRGTPRTALVAPVLLRDRPVCVLFADNGGAPVSARRLGDLLLLVSTLGAAFERIIRERKRRRAPARTLPPRAAQLAAEPAAAPPASDPWTAAAPGATPAPPAPAAAPADPWTATEPARPALAPAAAPAIPDELDALEIDVDESVVAPNTPPALLADRALDADPAVAAAACAALAARRREPAAREASERLRRALLSGIEARARRAARALGALRDVDAIPLLVQVLETSAPEPARAAADALADITLQRLGTDARAWLGWWKQNRGRGRAEWLFSGLTSQERETRVAAAVELSGVAPPPVAYSADLPPAERESAARAWAGWWSRSGNVL